MKYLQSVFLAALAVIVLASCGAKDAAKNTVDEISNDVAIRGHWLMTESDNAGTIAKALEKESLVLTFQDGNAGFEATNSLKGTALLATLSGCTKGPRPYKTDNNDLVFPAVTSCPELRVTVIKLDNGVLMFPDPENKKVTRSFVKIDDVRYQQLVHQ